MMERTSADFRSGTLWDYLTLSLLGILFFPVFVLAAALMLKVGDARWTIAISASALPPLFCYPILYKKPAVMQVWAIVSLVFIIIASAFFSALIYDQSYDGLVYHSDAILSLLRGANPAYRDMGGRFPFWTNHYPKGLWYFAAVVTHVTGNFQLGKSFNLLLIAAVFSYAVNYGRQRGLDCAVTFLNATAFALSPVAVNQLFSFYVDGALCSALTLVFLSALTLLYRPRTVDRLVFILAGCVLINIKFTGVAYLLAVMAISFIFIIGRYFIQKTLPPAAFKNGCYDGILILLVGFIIMGFNPYLTNSLMYHNPMYPLIGRHKIDVVVSQTPKIFKDEEYSGPHKFLTSLFSEGENFCHGITCNPAFKIPFTTSRDEVNLFANVDVRIGAWGVFYSGLLITGLALYILAQGWRDTESTLAIVMVLLTLFINPHAWWARYAPQAALLPLFLVLPALRRIRFAPALLAGSILNALLILAAHSLYFYSETERLQGQISHIVSTCGTGLYIVDGTPFHYEQFLRPRGIELTYAKPVSEGKPAGQDWLKLGDGYVKKAGCHPN